jgi:uncharacterized repeat protein (TIGR03803 family)
LYGAGTDAGANGTGGVFKLQPDGTGYAVIYSFAYSGSDGQHPAPALTRAANGALYGVTDSGGPNGGGTLFALQPDGTGFQVLCHFGNSGGDGMNPDAGLLAGRDGLLYGTTYSEDAADGFNQTQTGPIVTSEFPVSATNTNLFYRVACQP